jgi:hypothetical protein
MRESKKTAKGAKATDGRVVAALVLGSRINYGGAREDCWCRVRGVRVASG